MKYIDRIYGEFEIKDDIIIEIIETEAFQRLKGIDQAGYFQVYFPGTAHSRFEHSMGCYLLLNKFSASLKEQIAGLIHDVSHSAFSHTADYIFAGGRGEDHNYQDDIFIDFVSKTNIPQILRKYNFDVEEILNEDNFPLQETQLPNLCADRIDYSLRGAVIYGVTTKLQVEILLDKLQIIDNKWVFANYDSALKYAQIFKELNDIYYSNKETAAMFLRTSQWIKYALEKGYIKYEDMFSTDKNVISKINKHLDDEQLKILWDKMNSPQILLGKTGKKVVVKSRIVDPLFIQNGIIDKLSFVDANWENNVNVEMVPKTYYIS